MVSFREEWTSLDRFFLWVQFKPICRAFGPRGDSYMKVMVVIIGNFEKNPFYKRVPEYCFVGVV